MLHGNNKVCVIKGSVGANTESSGFKINMSQFYMRDSLTSPEGTMIRHNGKLGLPSHNDLSICWPTSDQVFCSACLTLNIFIHLCLVSNSYNMEV